MMEALITPLRRRNHEPYIPALPGSKSYTNRALVLAAQRVGTTIIRQPLFCQDTIYLAEALSTFGGIEITRKDNTFVVRRTLQRIEAPAQPLYVGAAGTPARFLLSFAASASGTTTITGNERLSERPMADLLRAFDHMGIHYETQNNSDLLPIAMHGGTPTTYDWEVNGNISSQFLSSLLLYAAQQQTDLVTITVNNGLVSKAYVNMTMEIMHQAGINCTTHLHKHFSVVPNTPQCGEFIIEPDASAMSYFLVAAAVTETSVCIHGIGNQSAQGDVGLVRVLEDMGCRVEVSPHSILLQGMPLHGTSIDMGNMPDTVLSLIIAAAHAKGKTHISNIDNLRLKECDRIAVGCQELNRLGFHAQEHPTAITIHGPGHHIRPQMVHTHDDHRVAMSFAILQLLYPNMTVEDPSCVTKSFPGYWRALRAMQEHHDKELNHVANL